MSATAAKGDDLAVSDNKAKNSSWASTIGKTFGLAAAIEIGLHIFVHYTVPGATMAAGLAKSIAPLLDSIGLTSVFTGAAAPTPLPSLDSLIPE